MTTYELALDLWFRYVQEIKKMHPKKYTNKQLFTLYYEDTFSPVTLRRIIEEIPDELSNALYEATGEDQPITVNSPLREIEIATEHLFLIDIELRNS